MTKDTPTWEEKLNELSFEIPKGKKQWVDVEILIQSELTLARQEARREAIEEVLAMIPNYGLSSVSMMELKQSIRNKLT